MSILQRVGKQLKSIGKHAPEEKFYNTKQCVFFTIVGFCELITRTLIAPIAVLARKIIQLNDKRFYSIYGGNNNPFLSFLNNLARPTRVMTKFVYGQIKGCPSFIRFSEKYNTADINEDMHDQYIKFKKDGIIALNGFESIADHILSFTHTNVSELKPSNDYKNFPIDEPDQKIIEFLSDKNILSVFAMYYGAQPFLRMPPDFIITYPEKDSQHTRKMNLYEYEKKANFAVGWHFDTVNMVQSALLLNDVTEEDSHMLFAMGAHKEHRQSLGKNDYFCSNEFIEDNYEIFHLTGKKGTVFLFDSNAPHCLLAKNNTCRLAFKTMYSPGNAIGILRHPNKKHAIFDADQLRSNMPSNFNDLQRNIYKYIT